VLNEFPGCAQEAKGEQDNAGISV